MAFPRRHPRPVEIGAWFDGEGADAVGAHVAGCDRCRARADDVAHLRAVLRPAPRGLRHLDGAGGTEAPQTTR